MTGAHTALAALQVFDRLDVGPVQLTRDKLVMPLKLTLDGTERATALSYRWSEPVFDPADPADVALASVIGAQLALNYGLFCNEWVFHGPFTPADRKLLDDHARNTAVEVLVNKLKRPNPFLRGLPDLSAVRDTRDVLLAPPTFADPPAPEAESAPWGEPGKTAVLSSGGKDSLLTLGLLRELGEEAHPIFVNESGRHWYTALNSYRMLRDSDPNTARVWCDCDRVFAWFLRQLPFVRPDFARVRADIYPVRLYTVAVFLVGALPLLRARGIGRLAIGDEHDTSERAVHQGIPHFSGLYDQSRWFDARMTAWLADRGNGVEVFSVLRACSELLIERTLADRYPELLATQVSCHATTVVGERARPCGKCEKCRRIVAMLTALGSDPRACGYSEEQIRAALRTLEQSTLSQEAVSAQEVARRLVARGFLDPTTPFGRSAAAHPEVLMLRFDPERSPRDAIPAALRGPVLELLHAAADGVVDAVDGRWVPR